MIECEKTKVCKAHQDMRMQHQSHKKITYKHEKAPTNVIKKTFDHSSLTSSLVTLS